MKFRKRPYIIFLIFSLILHLVVFLPMYQNQSFDKKMKYRKLTDLTTLKIHTIETNQVGSPYTLEFENKSEKLKKAEDKKISFSDLRQDTFDRRRPRAKNLLRQNSKKMIHTDGHEMRKFIAGSAGAVSTKEMLTKLGSNDISVSFGVPEDFKQDEYNKAELIFYGFRRRLLQAYLASFFTRLNDFTIRNPHLHFPMTEDDEVMTGQVTYDHMGNIMRIKMLRWTNKERLQGFFEEVLENLGALPNPPDEIVRDGQFHVYYTLNIKN